MARYFLTPASDRPPESATDAIRRQLASGWYSWGDRTPHVQDLMPGVAFYAVATDVVAEAEVASRAEPARGGFYAAPPPFDVSHAELVCTARDYHRFLRMLVERGRVEGAPVISEVHLRQMTSDQVPAENKTPDSFFPGFWDGTGWGFGVGVETRGPRRGRYGWSGGQGTNFYGRPGRNRRDPAYPGRDG